MVKQHAADTLQPFLDQLRKALTAVANGDPEPLKALCSHSDAISQCGFWGGVESGWAEVSERWWGQFTSRSEPTELMIRATLIFRREDGVWKAVHRHGDNAVAKAPPS